MKKSIGYRIRSIFKKPLLTGITNTRKLGFINDSQASVLRGLTTPDAINDGLVWLNANKEVQEAIRNPEEKGITKEQREKLIELTNPKLYDMGVLYDSIYVSEQLSKMYLEKLKKRNYKKLEFNIILGKK